MSSKEIYQLCCHAASGTLPETACKTEEEAAATVVEMSATWIRRGETVAAVEEMHQYQQQ